MLAPASQAVAPARTLRFEHLSVDQGLAQESVLAIVQDSDGFMWFGSQAGLSRFDGYRVVVYRHQSTTRAAWSTTGCACCMSTGAADLWIGTDGGLDRFDPDTQTFIHYMPKETVKARQRQPPHPRDHRRGR